MNAPPSALGKDALLTSPASAVLFGEIHLAWISESLQETGWRQSHEGLLKGYRPSSALSQVTQALQGAAPSGACLANACIHAALG